MQVFVSLCSCKKPGRVCPSWCGFTTFLWRTFPAHLSHAPELQKGRPLSLWHFHLTRSPRAPVACTPTSCAPRWGTIPTHLTFSRAAQRPANSFTSTLPWESSLRYLWLRATGIMTGPQAVSGKQREHQLAVPLFFFFFKAGQFWNTCALGV